MRRDATRVLAASAVTVALLGVAAPCESAEGADTGTRLLGARCGTPEPIASGLADPVASFALRWGPSCRASDVDYAVYEGTLGDFVGHAPVTCSTGGLTSLTFVPGTGGNRYFLVVPLSPSREGSHGWRSDGTERRPGAFTCLVLAIGGCL